MILGIIFCAIGLLYWFLGYRYKEPTLRNRLQQALYGNAMFLMGLSAVCANAKVPVDTNFYNWLLTGGIVSSLVSTGILCHNWMAKRKQERTRNAASLTEANALAAPETTTTTATPSRTAEPQHELLPAHRGR